MDCMRTNLTFRTTSREPSLNTREFCTARGKTMKNFLMKLWKRLGLNLFSVRRFAVPRSAIAMNTNSAFTGSYTENLFWYQQFDLRQTRILRGGQPIVDFDAADNCRLYVTTMKAMNFKDDSPSIPIDNFKNHYVLVFDLTAMQDATENCYYPELVGEPLRLELNFTFPLEQVTELIVLGELSSVVVNKFGVVGKNI